MLGLVHRYVMACGAVHGIRAMIDTMMQRWRKLGVAGQTSERRGIRLRLHHDTYQGEVYLLTQEDCRRSTHQNEERDRHIETRYKRAIYALEEDKSWIKKRLFSH